MIKSYFLSKSPKVSAASEPHFCLSGCVGVSPADSLEKNVKIITKRVYEIKFRACALLILNS